MGTGIMICGLNGTGKSTLGKALAEKLHFYFIDNEISIFPGQSFPASMPLRVPAKKLKLFFSAR